MYPTKKKTHILDMYLCIVIDSKRKMENAETNSVYLSYTSKTTRCQMIQMSSNCFTLFPPGAWLWSSFIAVSGRSLCIFLLSTCLGGCGASATSAPEKVKPQQAGVWNLEKAFITNRTVKRHFLLQTNTAERILGRFCLGPNMKTKLRSIGVGKSTNNNSSTIFC